MSQARERSEAASSGGVSGFVGKVKSLRGIAKFAAAAVLLVVVGYAVGRLSAPAPPDIEELQAALAICRNVIVQLRNDLRMGLATCYDRLSDELSRQQREDMAQFASLTLSAYNSRTNDLLAELIESINAAQTEERQWFTAALEQVEADRLRADAQLSTAFTTLAVQTQDELERTKQGFAQLLSYGLPEGSYIPLFEDPNNF